MKHRFIPANISVSMLFWLFLLCQPNLVYAGWDALGGETIPAYSDSPQHACEYISIYRQRRALPYRIAWVLPQGQEAGFYRPGFDVQGPPIPNPENNYTPPASLVRMYCIVQEELAFPLFYYPDPKPKIIAIDPGHGFTCAAKGMPPGAIGVTDFPPSNPPPGWLQEDELTMAIAREFERLASSKYTVILTKNSAIPCPTYEKRGEVAIGAEADVFVSVHINRRNPIPGNPFANGTSAIYNSGRPVAAKTLANLMAAKVSASLGVNNRGAMVDDGLAVLKKTVTPKMIAVLVEAARLSGSDEEKLHAAGSATKVAAGIKAALDAYFGN